MSDDLAKQEEEYRTQLVTDYPFYASECLKIKPKTGSMIPFEFNTAQHMAHEQIEAQLAEFGYVRALILKARQLGLSTYVEGRGYWKTSNTEAVKAYILTHEQAATNNLFKMVQEFHDNVPREVRPHTTKENEKEIVFDKLKSEYKIGTAGVKETGRSLTIQFFHGSEVAFWANAESHVLGVMEAVQMNGIGTEVYLESTANGIGGVFYEMWQSAVRGENGYIPIFIPWFVEEDYRVDVPVNFSPTDEELELKATYELDDEQLCFRRAKMATYTGTETGKLQKFKQEYPSTASEAFQSTGIDSLISAETVQIARDCEPLERQHNNAPRIMGVDPAGKGKDSTTMAIRQGRVLEKIYEFKGLSGVQVKHKAIEIATKEVVARCFFEKDGLGAPIFDEIIELGYGHIFKPVLSGGSAGDGERFYDKRTEMWVLADEWLRDQPSSIPDDEGLHGELTAPSFEPWGKNRVKLESNKDMKKRGLRSPDKATAFVLTFAELVHDDVDNSFYDDYEGEKKRTGDMGGGY